MARVRHGYNGRRGNDNRITDNAEWQELNRLAEASGQSVYVNHLSLIVGGLTTFFTVSDEGVRQALAALRERSGEQSH